ncbi:unnamed protein product [Protopolystoma xenopodis]|uniref:Uncharacterized protein n=1 Tax=Protopolystoma xenopodis TaxID=117903 RepID=A0A448WUR3_9PLAT|nr:unnamed protein product [Protopolystoma xenopodis]
MVGSHVHISSPKWLHFNAYSSPACHDVIQLFAAAVAAAAGASRLFRLIYSQKPSNLSESGRRDFHEWAHVGTALGVAVSRTSLRGGSKRASGKRLARSMRLQRSLVAAFRLVPVSQSRRVQTWLIISSSAVLVHLATPTILSPTCDEQVYCRECYSRGRQSMPRGPWAVRGHDNRDGIWSVTCSRLSPLQKHGSSWLSTGRDLFLSR